jgi:hypothetical protein
MKDWSSRKDRLDGRQAFWDKLSEPSSMVPGGLREQCINSSAVARTTFAQYGEFYLEGQTQPDEDKDLAPIPADTDFRVFPEDIAARDKLVVLILRDKTQPPPKETPDPYGIWACSYTPY